MKSTQLVVGVIVVLSGLYGCANSDNQIQKKSNVQNKIATDNKTDPTFSNNDNSDVIFSEQYVAEQIRKAEKGEINWEFAQLLGQYAEKDIKKGWYDAALEKLKPLLEIYEKGKADPPYIAGTATRLGLVLMHKKQVDEAAIQLEKAVGIWEGYNPSSNTDLVKREYLKSLVLCNFSF